jgi:EmrB/QacA subfamily drug resistance transporter
MGTLDAGIVTISLPRMMADLQTSLPVIEWVLLAYLLGITALLLPFGRLADMVGRKRVYVIGFVVFTAGSVLCGLAQTPWQLILFRAVQAVGSAMLTANSIAILTAVFPPEQRGRAMGMIGTVVAMGFLAGPVLGGLITDTLGWRYIFFVNLPIGVAATALAQWVLQEDRISPPRTGPLRFDFLGAATGGLAVFAVLLALTQGQDAGWTSPYILGLFAGAAALLAAFIWIEARTPDPMVDLTIFKRRLFAGGSTATLLSFLASSSNTFVMPFYLQLVLGLSPFQAGLVALPTVLTLAVVAPISGFLSERISARILSSLGLAILAVALLLVSFLPPDTSPANVIWRTALAGFGMGLFQSPNNNAVMSAVPRERYGIAGGFLSMMRNLGQVSGTALGGAILLAGVGAVVGHASLQALHEGAAATGGERDLLVRGFMEGFRHTYWVAAAIAVLGIFASLVRGRAEPAPAAVSGREAMAPDPTSAGHAR